MGKKCAVPTCKSGYSSCPEKVSMFAIPKDRLAEWQNAIGRQDRPLSLRDSVCEKHFRKSDIIRVVETDNYKYTLSFPKLSKTAIPSILLPSSKYQFRPRNKPSRESFSNGIQKLRSEDIMFLNETPLMKIQTFKTSSRKIFTKMLKEDRKAHENPIALSKMEYDKLISQIVRKETSDSGLHCSIVEVDGKKKLTAPLKRGINMRFYVHDDELYDILRNAHHALKHANPCEMSGILKRTYKNISFKDIYLFVSLCPFCTKRTRRKEKKCLIKKAENENVCCTELSLGCFLNVIDYQSTPDGEFKFILVYQNEMTKYYILKSLRSTNSDELYTVLSDIFSFIGAPAVIKSQIEDDVITDILQRIIKLWPNLLVTHVRLEDYQKNECHELIKEHLDSWMEHNETNKWTNGIRFVQMILNNEYDEDLNKTPYEVLFENVKCDSKMVNEQDDNPDKVKNENVIKEEAIEIFSFICDLCGNDNGNEQVCSICHQSL